MNGGVATLTAFAFAVGLWMYWRKLAAKTTTLLFLVAGFGISGMLGVLAGRFVSTVLGTVGATGSRWLGVGVSTIVACVALVATLEVVIKGLHKKKAKPTRWHPWLALVLPIIVTVGSVPLLTEVMVLFNQVTTEIGTSITESVGG